ncbi:MAG: hypothetical protein ACTSRU_10560 [Candidatus Hodarchaeales archaeon]
MHDRKSRFLLLFLVIVIFPAVISNSGGPISSISSSNVEIDLVTSEYYYAPDYLKPGEGLNCLIYLQDGDKIDFYVMDENDFVDFSNNREFSYFIHENISNNYSSNIQVPYEDNWYAVIYNDPINLLDSVTVEFDNFCSSRRIVYCFTFITTLLGDTCCNWCIYYISSSII